MKEMYNADLRLLTVFVTIVRCGSFQAAESVLNIAQSAISEQMKRLETKLGARLCDRGRAGFRLTEAGEQTFEAAERLLSAVETFYNDTSVLTHGLRGEIKLGLIDNTASDDDFLLVPVLQQFRKQASEVHIQIEINNPHGLEQRVLDGRLYAAIGPFPTQVLGLNYEPFYEEDHFLYCSSEHELFTKDDVSVADLKQCEMIARSYEHGNDLKHLKQKQAAAIADNLEAALLLILTGNYIGFMPKHYAAAWEEKGKLKQLLPEKVTHKETFFLVSKAGEHQSVVLSTFLNTIRKGFNLPIKA